MLCFALLWCGGAPTRQRRKKQKQKQKQKQTNVAEDLVDATHDVSAEQHVVWAKACACEKVDKQAAAARMSGCMCACVNLKESAQSRRAKQQRNPPWMAKFQTVAMGLPLRSSTRMMPRLGSMLSGWRCGLIFARRFTVTFFSVPMSTPSAAGASAFSAATIACHGLPDRKRKMVG